MQRDLVLTAVFFVVSVLVEDADGKLCHSMDVRNSPRSLEKLRNCTIIMGHLHIVLMDSVEAGAFDGYSFPELTEIVEYLLVFKIAHLTNIGKLFPNLRVIRGNRLYMNYAIVVFDLANLREIGLSNLQHIGRGAIKVDKCPSFCYADTIDWQAIGASKLDYYKTNEAICEKQTCPMECHGYCWSKDQCQKFTINKCHELCVGCTKEDSPDHCHSCKYFEDDGKCVKRCPKHKIVNNYSMKCLTEEECSTMFNSTWWVFKGECVRSCPLLYAIDPVKGGCRFLGEGYKKDCSGTVVDSLTILDELAPCTSINGSLDLRISEPYLVDHLAKGLGLIQEISGSLKIGRSNAIRSLDFFKKLRVIKGRTTENKGYALFVFENQNLQRLWNFTGNFSLTIGNGGMAFHDNPQLCDSEIEKLKNVTRRINSKKTIEIFAFSNGDKSSCNPKDMTITIVENNPTNVTLSWQRLETTHNETVIGYTVYYIPSNEENLTPFESKDVCNVESWRSIFVSNNSVQLKLLAPYTRYGYYIKVYSTSQQGEQSPIYYFQTSSDDPSEPDDFEAESKNDTTIVLKWRPPRFLNGKFSYYNITILLERDYLPIIEQRNYCQHPHTSETEEVTELGPALWTKTPTTSNCSCDMQDQFQIFKKNMYELCEDGSVSKNCRSFFYNHTAETLHRQKRTEIANNNQNFQRVVINNLTTTVHEVTGLRHFSLYIFFLIACNVKEGDRDQCSPIVMSFARTKSSNHADNVGGLKINVDGKNAFVTWSEPEQSNSVLVAYQIQRKKVDSEHAKSITECITREQYQKIKHRYQILELPPGKYAIRVRAVSLSGVGNFSPPQFFEIASPNTMTAWIYGLLGFIVVVAVVMAGLWYMYKRKYGLDSNHLITSINPDYAGPIYEEDEWEIDRSDVQIIKELGQGSFGMVYQGMIKSRRYPCAIKTVSESASMPSRMEFLNEGAVMKTFNDAHHVIKLLGIVSRGQPPLVVMELMERGDLKLYLRRCREPSQNLTTNEMYRMAAEIADGMAYLAAKKFVHRDLAARNCMVAADRTVKIGDFGMARDIYETDYYRKETVGLLPVRWMAPESLADGVFTSDSDVWSYGIVLWEMATLAEQPYQGLSNEEVFHFVKSRGKLERPAECSDLLFEVMDACWLWRPNDRPTFADIVDKLVGHVGEDFRLVAFCYSRQGRELALNAGPRVYNPPAMMPAPEDDVYGHYDASDEEVNLYVKESSRPTKFLPLLSQRYNKSSPYQISPGSPSSTFSLNSS